MRRIGVWSTFYSLLRCRGSGVHAFESPDGLDDGVGVEDEEREPGPGLDLRARDEDGMDHVLVAVPNGRPTLGDELAVDSLERVPGDG